MSQSQSLADIAPQELQAELSSDQSQIKRTASITHGSAVSVVVDDQLQTYDHLRNLWRENVGEAGEEAVVEAHPEFMPEGDYVWKFSSSKWKAGAENAHGDWKRYYEYHIRLRKRITLNGEEQLRKPATSLSLDIQPQSDELCYQDGNDYSLPYGEGSRIRVKTTYAERSGDVLDRLFNSLSDCLDALDGNPDIVSIGALKPESARISKLETYLRFDVDQKHKVKRCLDKSENLIDVGGGSEIQTFKQRQEEGWLEARVSSDRWNRLGLEPLEVDCIINGNESTKRLERELKVYQATDWHERGDDDPLHHPKIEASLDGGSAHISEWDAALDSLRQLLLAHMQWSGVSDDELIADEYFKPAIQPTIQFDHPEGRRDDLRRYYSRFEAVIWSESLKYQTDAVYDILSYLSENYGATYEQLETATGFSRSNLDYHVGRLREAGLVTTVGNPAIVCFDADELYERVLELIDSKIAPHFDEETLAARRIGREERAQSREEARENGEANGTEPNESQQSDAQPEESSDGSDSSDSSWIYLDDWHGSLLDAEHQLESPDHPRGPRDIRLRELD